MSDITVYMLPVGQGAMNLITEYDGLTLVNLVLIDCGELRIESRKNNNKQASDASKEFVKDKMKERFYASCGETCLDFLLITHRDQDHILFATELFNINPMALLLNRSMYYMEYDETQYTDEYLLLTDQQKVQCSRTIKMDMEYTDYSIFTALSRQLFTIDYCDTQTKFRAECRWETNYWINIKCEYNDVKKTIFADSKHSNQICVEINSSVYYINIDTSYVNRYDRLLCAFFRIFDNECAYLGSYETIKGKFDLLQSNTYKSYVDVLKDFVESKTCYKKPIARCFIGGNQNQAKKTIDLIYGLTKEDKVFNPEEDKFKFRDNFELQIIHYAQIDQMLEFMHSIDSPNNATSAVSLLYDPNNNEAFKVLFTGDATHQTFYMINQKEYVVALLTNAIWTAPHHGSTKTLGNDGQKSPIDEILNVANVQAIVISAGYKNRFCHPHGSFIKKFKNYFADKGEQSKDGLHMICYNCNGWADDDGWVCQPTIFPIYSTLTGNSFTAHIFEYPIQSTKSKEFYYDSMSFSTVTSPYNRIDRNDEKTVNSLWPPNCVASAGNEKTKTVGVDITLKKMFIIR